MKKLFRITFFASVLLLAISCLPGCSSPQPDPSDYISSFLSGEYGKNKFWKLTTTINGDTVPSDGFVRFDSKYEADDADFIFVNVIPGESSKEFKRIPLESVDDGLSFTIDYTRKSQYIHISGIVTFGEMTVNMTLSE